MFDDMKFDETCDCGGSFSFTVGDLANGRTVRCSRGCTIRIEDSGGGARGAQRAGRDLERALKKLDRNFKL